MNKIILVGGFKEIIELAEDNFHRIEGIIDNKNDFKDYHYIGNDVEALNIASELKSIPLIISPDTPKVRRKLKNYYLKHGFSFGSLVSNKAKVSKTAHISLGSIIQFGVNISSNVRIGEFCKLNTYCNLMHDINLGPFTTVAPNAVILGHVSIGSNCYIGANSTVLPKINICNDVMIGAGAVVTKDIYEPGIYAGIPAVKLR